MDPACRQLIVDHFAWLRRATGRSCQPPCVFGDLESCVPPNSYDPAQTFLQKLQDVDDAPLIQKQHCYTHGKNCPLFGEGTSATLEVAGLPCWDMSAAGKRLKEHGRTATVFICHAKRHVEKRTPLIVIENTKARRSS